MEETQPLPQAELQLCDSLIIWVSTRGRRGFEGPRRVGPREGGSPFSLGSQPGHLHRGLGAAPSAPPGTLDRESATCGPRGRCVCTRTCVHVYTFVRGAGEGTGTRGGGPGRRGPVLNPQSAPPSQLWRPAPLLFPGPFPPAPRPGAGLVGHSPAHRPSAHLPSAVRPSHRDLCAPWESGPLWKPPFHPSRLAPCVQGARGGFSSWISATP